jgi:hypothetical protein
MSAMDKTGPLAIFGDLEGDIWGVLLGGERPCLAVAGLAAADVKLGPAQIDREDDDVWTLIGPGAALRIERAEATTCTGDADHRLAPCRVSGSVAIDGLEREFDVAGLRSDGFATDGNDSLRLFGAWFPAGHEVAVLSARPRGAKGHDRDQLAVVARGEQHALVFDPRLSTTYDEHGDPRRVGVELWLGDDAEGDQSPRRVAGLATGSRVTAAGISAHAFQCASRGEAGAGVYVLARG